MCEVTVTKKLFPEKTYMPRNFDLSEWKQFTKDSKLFNSTMDDIWHNEHKGPDYAWLPIQLDLNILQPNNLEFSESHELFSPEDRNTDLFKHKTYEKNYIQKAKSNDTTHEYLANIFDLKYVDAPVHVQNPGNYVAPHFDLYGYFLKRCPDYFNTAKLKRFAIFLSKWEVGQAFLLGKSAVTNWKPGDVIEFPWYMVHSTMNISKSPRLYMNVVGLSK